MPKSFSDLCEHVEKVSGFVSSIQIDLMDGEYVENKSWPFFDKDKQSVRELMNGEIKLPNSSKIKYEFDLMIRNPENDLKKFIKLGAGRLIIHANSIGEKEYFLKEVKGLGVEWGIAFLTTDNLKNFEDLIREADFIQLMGIENIGFQGQGFDPRALDQVKNARETKEDVIISIDGGVNLDTAKELASVGVNRLVSGSAIFGANAPEVAIEDLKRISNG